MVCSELESSLPRNRFFLPKMALEAIFKHLVKKSFSGGACMPGDPLYAVCLQSQDIGHITFKQLATALMHVHVCSLHSRSLDMLTLQVHIGVKSEESILI